MFSRVINRRLLGALAVSLLLHWLFVSGKANWLPTLITDADPIQVTLVLPPAPPPVKLTPRLTAPEVKTKVAPKPVAVTKPELPPAPPLEHQLPPVALSDAATIVQAPYEPSPTIQQAQAEPLPVIKDDPEPIPLPPKKVEIEFIGNGDSKGSGIQSFERLDNGRYVINSELSIPAFLFVSATINQRSEGLITATGLQPSQFRQKITTKNPQIATFDWANKKVTLDSGKRTETVELPVATQDRLSFMYQFMFVPPLNEMQLSITDGKKLKTYNYEFEGEDSLSTKMGTLRTWHIAKSNRDSDAKTELWLAIDQRHLPVRIRVTEKDGSVTDLIVSNLKIES
ncbi:MAG: DUF3108 domain-containing protein [Methylophilales bacterium]|nr:DUF3108 domain-containing protein [Methylophilales bacterium]